MSDTTDEIFAQIDQSDVQDPTFRPSQARATVQLAVMRLAQSFGNDESFVKDIRNRETITCLSTHMPALEHALLSLIQFLMAALAEAGLSRPMPQRAHLP